MTDSDTMGCLQQKTVGCHFGTLGLNFKEQKQNDPRYFKVKHAFQKMRLRASVIVRM